MWLPKPSKIAVKFNNTLIEKTQRAFALPGSWQVDA
jgi:hypothetical protein